MRKFRDISTGEIITEEELRKEFERLKKETPEEYDYSFKAQRSRNPNPFRGLDECDK